ncbi:hypothetical protein E2C01_041928 [Portunus trituberculatus]|uniref:Uncharacterized protein n=1 Tax=Portunus trituberculatus TaxID=210409 RepID=A0A5B7FKH1_PORTR|nr:hypothetical protein [Portunus trituberculatus]
MQQPGRTHCTESAAHGQGFRRSHLLCGVTGRFMSATLAGLEILPQYLYLKVSLNKAFFFPSLFSPPL